MTDGCQCRMQMVVEFAEPCSSCCEQPAVVQSQLDTFVRNMQQLSNEQISSALKISRMDILNQVSQLVPCVGCRHRLLCYFTYLCLCQAIRLQILEPISVPCVICFMIEVSGTFVLLLPVCYAASSAYLMSYQSWHA